MSEILSAAGGMGMMVVGVAALGAVVTLGLGGLAATKRRVPLTAFVLFPFIVAIAGAVGAFMSAGAGLSSIAGVEPSAIPNTATAAYFESISVDVLARWTTAALFTLATWTAGLGAFMAGDDSKMTPVASVLALILTIIGGVTLFMLAGYFGVGTAVPLIAIFGASGVGVAIGSIKRALWEHTHRVASMRFVSGICMILAVYFAGRAMAMGVELNAMSLNGVASQTSDLYAAIEIWGSLVDPASYLCWTAVAFSLAIGLCGFYYELGDVLERFTLLDIWGTIALGVALIFTQLVKGVNTSPLLDLALNQPAVALFHEMGANLPPAIISMEDESLAAQISIGGFGDVFTVIEVKEGEGDEKTVTNVWKRVRKWNGAGWDWDETPIDEVAGLNGPRPLFVLKSSEDSGQLTSYVQKLGGEALLLLKASEVKEGVDVPSPLGKLQFTFLPLSVTTPDLKAMVWTEAGRNDVHWGPTLWFGEEEDEVPVHYMAAVREQTKSNGIYLLTGERTRARDIAASCVPTLVEFPADAEEPTAVEGAQCVIGEGELEPVRKEVMALWDAPTAENTTMTFETEIPAITDAAFFTDRLTRELSAIDYCINSARDEGEDVVGTLLYTIEIDKDGAITVGPDAEESKIRNRVVDYCIRSRFRGAQFEVDADNWPEAPSEEEPVPPQVVTMAITLK